MSEEQNKNEQQVNNPLTERVNNAFIANNYTLLNGGTDNVVMISGEKENSINGVNSVDVLLTLEGMEEMATTLRAEVNATKKVEPSELPVTDELI